MLIIFEKNVKSLISGFVNLFELTSYQTVLVICFLDIQRPCLNRFYPQLTSHKMIPRLLRIFFHFPTSFFFII